MPGYVPLNPLTTEEALNTLKIYSKIFTQRINFQQTRQLRHKSFQTPLNTDTDFTLKQDCRSTTDTLTTIHDLALLPSAST
jgi:hypothetical protein